ncbi:MAG: hypothetical protein WD399_10815 [Thermoleophilaceae bacterium]
MPITRLMLLATALALALPAAATAAPTAVDVRIEGKASTIFAGPVTTDGKVVDPATAPDHLCDGTNFGANPTSGPTPTTALDDAAIKGGFTWDGTWFGPGFPDYAIDRVADEPATSSEFWGVFVNGVMLDVGGCQRLLKAGDEVLWAFDAFSKDGALELASPATIKTGQRLDVGVTNRATGVPIADATVGSATTAANGVASLSFDDPGVYRLKAEKAGYIRSSEVRVCVDPPLVDACTSTDRTAPTVRLDVPRIASSLARFGFVRVSWQGDDGEDGSGVRRYRVDTRRIDVPGKPWRALAVDTRRTQARIPAKDGSAYEIRVQAIDRAGNASPHATRTVLMPVDNLDPRIRFSRRGWATLKRHGAFKRSVARAGRPGATARLRFKGTRATIVTRTLRHGGRLRITVDGDSRVVRLRGRGAFRERLVSTKALAPGRHTLRIRSLGGGPVEIDAVAIKP